MQPPIAPLTVEFALRESVLSEARLVGGVAQVDRRIDGVGVLDTTDLDRLSPHRLMLVSAYSLHGADLPSIFRLLRAREASGLGVKLEPYWQQMPVELVELADAAGLPLLTLPPGRFEDIVHPLQRAILDRQAQILRSLEVFHQALTEMALSEEPPGAAAPILADALGLGVAIFDDVGEVVVAVNGAAGWVASAVGGAIAAEVTGSVSVDGESYYVAPISARGRRYGAVCVRGADPDDPIVRGAVAQAAVVTAMQLLGRRQIEAVHRKFERELLDDIAGGRLVGREARQRAQAVGWAARRPFILVVADRRPSSPGAVARTDVTALADDTLDASTRALNLDGGHSTRVFAHQGRLAIVVHLERAEQAREACASVVDRLTRFWGLPWPADDLVAASSRPFRDIVQLPLAFREAGLTLALSSNLRDGCRRVEHFEDLGAARLIAYAANPERLAGIARDELRELADDGGDRALDTLTVLLQHNMRVGRSAEELFYHYNTVRQRLARLRWLFGEELDSPQGQLSLWLAILSRRISEIDRGLSTLSKPHGPLPEPPEGTSVAGRGP